MIGKEWEKHRNENKSKIKKQHKNQKKINRFDFSPPPPIVLVFTFFVTALPLSSFLRFCKFKWNFLLLSAPVMKLNICVMLFQTFSIFIIEIVVSEK